MRRSPKGSPGAVLDLQRRVDQAVSADHAELMTIAKDANTFFGAESVQDPYPLYERMRAAGSVHRIANSDFYAVCGWDAVNEAIGRPEDFSSNLTATMTYTAEGTAKPFEMDPLGGPTHVLATADDPAHAVHRKLVLRHLAAKRIRVMEQFTVQAADRLWVDGMQDGCIEWMGAMANRLPMMVVAELIGLPDPDIAQLVKWGYAATQLLEGLVENDQLVAAGVALMELSGYIFEQFDRAAADPRDNLLGELATACASGELDTLTAQVMMVTLFAAGGESTAALLGSAVWILATRPDIQQQVRANPELLGAFIEETLRYEPPFRATTATCETPPPWTARNCPRIRTCCCCGARPTAIQPSSRHPASSVLTVQEAKATSVSEKGPTSVSALHWHAWRLESSCVCCSIAPR